jgi:hypothetical protein
VKNEENRVDILDSAERGCLVPKSGRGGSGTTVGADGLVERLIFGCDNLNDAVDERYEEGGHTGPCCDITGGKFRRLAVGAAGASSETVF